MKKMNINDILHIMIIHILDILETLSSAAMKKRILKNGWSELIYKLYNTQKNNKTKTHQV